MQRYPLNWRQQVYNEADFYKLTPLLRKPIAPGESISTLVVDARFVSAVFPKVVTTPLLCQAWAFYVPHRLVYPEWVDFIALSDAVTVPPMTAVTWDQVFDHGSTSRTALYRRGLKLIYNQYFGDETVGQANEAWYDDVNADAYTTLHRLLAWDQVIANRSNRGAYTQSTFAAAVSGATATIQLDDLQRALRNNTARRRQKTTGDKYVDTMRLMGVELDWRVQMAPEYLGSAQSVILPHERSSAGTDLTVRVSEWSGKFQLASKRRMAFAEHGYLYVLVGFRPSLMLEGTSGYDSTVFGTQDGFFRPDSAGAPGEVSSSSIRARFVHYAQGSNLIGINHNGNCFAYPAASPDFYPDPTKFVVAAGSGPRHMAFTADVSVRGQTPVHPNRV